MINKRETSKTGIGKIKSGQSDRCSSFGILGGPFVFTDRIGINGHESGFATFTLEATRTLTAAGKVVCDSVVVAHVRMPISTMLAFKNSIAQIELMLNSPSGT